MYDTGRPQTDISSPAAKTFIFVFEFSTWVVISKRFWYIKSVHVDLSTAIRTVAVAGVLIAPLIPEVVVLTVGDVGEETVD
jgi:hypothetical protein